MGAGVAANAGGVGLCACGVSRSLSSPLSVSPPYSQLTPLPPALRTVDAPSSWVGCREGRCSLGSPGVGAEAQLPSWNKEGFSGTSSSW